MPLTVSLNFEMPPLNPMIENGSHARDASQSLRMEGAKLRSMVRDLLNVVHGLGHDLREPIRLINCYAQLLQSQARRSADSNDTEYLHLISTAAQRMDALLTGILDYAQVIGAESRLSHAPVNMNAVVQAAVANLKMQIDQTGATIIHDELPVVTGDSGQLTQFIQNLVSNSIKYRSVAPPQIIVSAHRGATEWLFSVQDNGVGVESHHHGRLFLPFTRLHGRDIPGTGLGLTICHSIVERHGGRIWVDSAVGHGRTFSFTLQPYEGPHERA